MIYSGLISAWLDFKRQTEVCSKGEKTQWLIVYTRLVLLYTNRNSVRFGSLHNDTLTLKSQITRRWKKPTTIYAKTPGISWWYIQGSMCFSDVSACNAEDIQMCMPWVISNGSSYFSAFFDTMQYPSKLHPLGTLWVQSMDVIDIISNFFDS